MKKTYKGRILSQDDRGSIVELAVIGRKITTLLRITSKKGAVRANHYHHTDAHYCYLTKGLMRYTERTVGSKKKKSRLVKPGEMVLSKPGVIHAMQFLKESEMIVITTESRKQADYERDTVRTTLV